jgi:non-heme chloroperoxidase
MREDKLKLHMTLMTVAMFVLLRPASAQTDQGNPVVRSVTADDNVKLEVLDWGGSGKPLVFLAGLGATAHVFDQFAPRFSSEYHVYGITRRGYGNSDKPVPNAENYSADRLGNDVVQVIDALKLDKPVLVGWSFGGEELSSVADRYPAKVAGLVYIDAAYAYAFYAPGNQGPFGANLMIDANAVRKDAMIVGDPIISLSAKDQALADLAAMLPALKTDLDATSALWKELPKTVQSPPDSPQLKIGTANFYGMARYGHLSQPILAMFAHPHALPPNAPPQSPAAKKMMDEGEDAQIERFRRAYPDAHVVLIPDAQHAMFVSNQADVRNAMEAFLSGLH